VRTRARAPRGPGSPRGRGSGGAGCPTRPAGRSARERQDVAQRVGAVVVLDHERRWARSDSSAKPGLEAVQARRHAVGRAAHVQDHHGLGPEAHGVHEVGLQLEVADRAVADVGIHGVQDDVLAGWVDRRTSAARASAPISASSGPHASTCPRNWGGRDGSRRAPGRRSSGTSGSPGPRGRRGSRGGLPGRRGDGGPTASAACRARAVRRRPGP
jgi:hypothetical protein